MAAASGVRPRRTAASRKNRAVSSAFGCCTVEAVVTIDGRGQIVLPKDVREDAGLRGGDKLAVISWKSDGETCCISLVEATEFAGTVKSVLGPMLKEILET